MKNEPVSSPTIWQALDDWAKKLKPWQRQILAFATQNGRLSKEQVDVSYELFLEEHNLAEKKPRDPVVIDVSGRPSDALSDKLRLDLIDELVDWRQCTPPWSRTHIRAVSNRNLRSQWRGKEWLRPRFRERLLQPSQPQNIFKYL
jgi:hypothetical protein